MHCINLEVVLKKGETVERLIKRFLKKMKKNKLMDELKAHEYYISPSEERRREEKIKMRKIQKAQEEIDERNSK